MPFTACIARKSTDFPQEGVINQNLLKETKFIEILQLDSNGKYSGIFKEIIYIFEKYTS